MKRRYPSPFLPFSLIVSLAAYALNAQLLPESGDLGIDQRILNRVLNPGRVGVQILGLLLD